MTADYDIPYRSSPGQQVPWKDQPAEKKAARERTRLTAGQAINTRRTAGSPLSAKTVRQDGKCKSGDDALQMLPGIDCLLQYREGTV